MRDPLTRYRAMAMIVGTMLLVLVLVGMPLQYGFGRPGLADVVAPVHGILYIVYLLTVLDLARRDRRLSLRQLAAMVGAGFVPFLAFVIERRITVQLAGHPGEARTPPAPRAEAAPGDATVSGVPAAVRPDSVTPAP
jgi:integral membrane protein